MASFSFPVVGTSLHEQADTYGAGRSGGRSHKGIDIFANEGAPVVAVTGGTVVKSGNSGGLGGIRAWVRDDDGNYHYYAHMSDLNVRDGQRVEAGQRIGAVGNTGTEARNTPHHLHYSVNPSQSTSEQGAFNPFEYLQSNKAITALYDGETGVTPSGSTSLTVENTTEPVDPAQEFEDSRRESTQVFADIFSSVSEMASRRGGEVIDVPSMFKFDDEPEDAEVA